MYTLFSRKEIGRRLRRAALSLQYDESGKDAELSVMMDASTAGANKLKEH